MHKILVLAVALVLALGTTSSTLAGDTLVLARASVTDKGATSMRFLDISHSFGRTILALDFIDFGDSGYHEVSAGAGTIIAHGHRGMLGTIGYVMKTTGGHAAAGEYYFQPLVFGAFNMTSRLKLDGAILPYVPLSSSATRQLSIDHLKLDVNVGAVTLGAGYGGFRFGDGPWAHKPMISLQIPGAKFAGSPELWLQKIPGGVQVQLRTSWSF